MSALHQFPAVNAVIDGDDIIYRDYVDISVAVGTAKVWSFALITIAFDITNLVLTRC